MTNTKLIKLLNQFNTPDDFIVLKQFSFLVNKYNILVNEALHNEDNYELKPIKIKEANNTKEVKILKSDIETKLRSQCMELRHKLTFKELIDSINKDNKELVINIKLAYKEFVKALKYNKTIVVVNNVYEPIEKTDSK